MSYGWPLPKRLEYIRDQNPSSQIGTHKIEFQGESKYYPVYRLPTDMPKYRLANGRTQAAQKEYIALHPNAGADFFTRDLESEEAQRVQDGLLQKMLKTAGLLAYFKSRPSQLDPIILSSEGFVVNGNRRLCAFRLLYNQDKKFYETYSHVDAVLLPTADEKDIDELEANLQVRQDIRADYTWIDRAMMMRERMEKHKYQIKDLARLYELSVNQITEYLDMLTYAEQWLRSRDNEGKYSELEGKGEYAFRQLCKNRKKLPREESRELLRIISFALIDDPEGGRVYDAIPDSAKYLDPISVKLQSIVTLSASKVARNVADADDSALLGRKQQPSLSSDFLSALDLPIHREEIREIVREVIDHQESLEHDKVRARAFVERLQRAHGLLTEAYNVLTDESELAGTEEQIRGIEAQVAKIREWVRGYSKR